MPNCYALKAPLWEEVPHFHWEFQKLISFDRTSFRNNKLKRRTADPWVTASWGNMNHQPQIQPHNRFPKQSCFSQEASLKVIRLSLQHCLSQTSSNTRHNTYDAWLRHVSHRTGIRSLGGETAFSMSVTGMDITTWTLAYLSRWKFHSK